MKRLIFITAIIVLTSCHRDEGLAWFSAGKAAEYFRLTEEVCNNDNGKLWGENLYGPVMYVDGRNRAIYTNVADKEDLLKAREGVFTGVLPKERIIANNVIEFGGVRYAMVPLPDAEDRYRMVTRTVHSLFHSYQERHVLKPSTFSTRHLNDGNARLYLKLEWKALTYAIGSSGETRNQAIRDALVFRGARRELFPEAIADENKFENYEGLTTFTYIKLCTSGPDELKNRILEYLDRIYQNNSYAWGYGFVHGALYATLLNDKDFDFKQIQQSDFDLGKAALEAYGVTLPAVCRDVAGSLAMNYDIQAIRAEESKREEMINENTRRIVTTFNEKPVVTITMESPNFSFEPEDINFLDTLGTLYEKLRVSDNWGRLAVNEGGALLTNDLHTLRVSARDIVVEKNHIYGAGWHLVLNDGWHAVPADDGSYTVIKN
ncbi:MAG: hypothetical protein U5L72_07110 [Bacteroidales bacterium]|nr:hypothetical protein [Bacteroidales bacterium]